MSGRGETLPNIPSVGEIEINEAEFVEQLATKVMNLLRGVSPSASEGTRELELPLSKDSVILIDDYYTVFANGFDWARGGYDTFYEGELAPFFGITIGAKDNRPDICMAMFKPVDVTRGIIGGQLLLSSLEPHMFDYQGYVIAGLEHSTKKIKMVENPSQHPAIIDINNALSK